MAFKMKGFSPFTKKEEGHFLEKEQTGPIEGEKRQVPKQPGESEGLAITGGSKSEEINDLEDRIEFLNNDIEELTDNDEQSIENANNVRELRNAKKKLQKRLSEMRKSSPAKDMKTGSYKHKFE